jgi:hypothetical protein
MWGVTYLSQSEEGKSPSLLLLLLLLAPEIN